MPKTMDDIFAEEEARALAEHNAWLNDPIAQAAHKAKIEADIARRETLPEDAEETEIEDEEEEEEEEENAE